MSSWSTAPKWIEFSQILSNSHWGPSLSGLGTEQHQGQSLTSGVLVRSDRDGPSCATLTCRRARLGLTDRPWWLNQKESLLVTENKWHGQPRIYTAYDFTTSHTIPFLQKTVLNNPKWNQKVDWYQQGNLVADGMTSLTLYLCPYTWPQRDPNVYISSCSWLIYSGLPRTSSFS